MSLRIEEVFGRGFPVCDVSYWGNVLRMFVIQNRDLGYYVVSRKWGKIGSDYVKRVMWRGNTKPRISRFCAFIE